MRLPWQNGRWGWFCGEKCVSLSGEKDSVKEVIKNRMIGRIKFVLAVVAMLVSVAVSARVGSADGSGDDAAIDSEMVDGRDGCAADTTISMVTFFQGSDIYELEGHSALRITTPMMDVAVSYGTFDFNSPGFVYRFVKGETDYWVEAIDWHFFLGYYVRHERRVVQQVLNMSAAEKQRLISLVAENIKPENRVYRYNYVKDNCATRPLAIVEAAYGDSIKLGEPVTEAVAGDCSFRDIMTYYHANYPWYQFGIDLSLGSGIDYRLNNREKAFAPVILCEQLVTATVGGKPVVAQTIVLNDVQAENAIEGPTPAYATPMALALLVLVLAAFITYRDVKRLKVNRVFDSVYFAITGLTGCLITFLVFVSTHEATSPNGLILWLNPLCLVPVVSAWISPRTTRYYHIFNSLALFLMILAWGIFGQQMNRAFMPLIMVSLMRSISTIYIYKQTNHVTNKVKS